MDKGRRLKSGCARSRALTECAASGQRTGKELTREPRDDEPEWIERAEAQELLRDKDSNAASREGRCLRCIARAGSVPQSKPMQSETPPGPHALHSAAATIRRDSRNGQRAATRAFAEGIVCSCTSLREQDGILDGGQRDSGEGLGQHKGVNLTQRDQN